MSQLRDKYCLTKELEQEVSEMLEGLKHTFQRAFAIGGTGGFTTTEKERVESAIRIIDKQHEKILRILLNKTMRGGA